MVPIAVGETIPEGTLPWFNEDELQQLLIHSLAAGKKVALFGVLAPLPLPAVNGPFVTKAWAKTYPENKHVKFLADGSGTYMHALGLELDLSDKGFGTCSWRFALLLEDLKVKVADV